jgi:hypothetical protein
MRKLPPRLRLIPVLLGALLVLAAVAWSARTTRDARVVAARPTVAPAAPVRAAAPMLAASAAVAPVVNRSVAAVRAAAPGQAGMRAFIDPETGTLGGPVTDAGSNVIIDTGEGLVEERLPNGAVKIDLQGQFQEYAVMQLDANGHPVMRCVPNPKLALKNGVAPAAAPVER